MAAWGRALAEGTDYEIEVRNRCRDGGYRWFLTRARPVRDAQGAVIEWYGSTTDIHDRKLSEAALCEANVRKDEFLAMLAHELRNPLAPIRTGLQLMKLVKDDPALLEETRSMMERQTQLLIALVDDLLDVSRISRGKLEMRKRRVSLDDIVQDAVEASRPRIDQAGHELIVNMPERPVLMDADPYRLSQAISNLLNNAAKYTPQAGKIWLDAREIAGEVELTVKDKGVGIPSHQLDGVFEMFFQIRESAKGSNSGLGIGLWLVKSIVETHGGSIQVRSEGPNRGSEFTVRLPVLATAVVNKPTTAEPSEVAPDTLPRRVLIVDDNVSAAKVLSRLVMTLGHQVRSAGDGYEAVAVASEFHPHVVLMDLGMPRMDGYEAASELRRQAWGRDMVLVALTGWGQETDRRRTKEAGFDHHLVKPAGLADLQRLLGQQ
jgi:signal transduction histidine kinase